MPAFQRQDSSDEFQASRIKKRLSPAEALAKIQRYCAYQERSHKEVKNKLYDYGLYATQVEEIISQLITDGFLNEERFAKAYAGGKFRMKKWGKLKIKNELEFLGLTKNCIQRGLKEIESTDYTKTLKVLIKKKSTEITDENRFKKRDKVARFVIGKGYEPELVWEYVKDLLPD
ncbi:MAG TPA: regulatory protein RecX [Cyclobacteriaceae bacterium]|nr:regulatory protein RecX [Cyclobacteriaceae bacterium]HPW63381.1 regulatory protein RecX [Cyclobacteriaceae bacterium]